MAISRRGAVAKRVSYSVAKKSGGERREVSRFEAVTKLPDSDGVYEASNITEAQYEKLSVPDITTKWTAQWFVNGRIAEAVAAMTYRDTADYDAWADNLRGLGQEPPAVARLAWLRARSPEADKALKTSVVEAMSAKIVGDDHAAKRNGPRLTSKRRR